MKHHQSTVALVTGSTSGIGLGVARSLAQKGYNLLLHGLGDEAANQKLCDDLAGDYEIKVSLSSADLQDASTGAALVRQAHEELGSCDVIVNNAGIQHVAPIENFPVEKWNAILAINLSAAFHTTQAALPAMRAKGFGRIINIASVHGLVGSPNKSAYVAAKHGLLGLTKVIALEMAGSGITCNAICPGWVKTPLVEKQIIEIANREKISIEQAENNLLFEKQPSLKFVTPEQIGELAVYLASEAAAQMTGAALPIDGGWTAR